MKKMATSDVLIVGLNGLGVEAAKNVILAGKIPLYFFQISSSRLSLSTLSYIWMHTFAFMSIRFDRRQECDLL